MNNKMVTTNVRTSVEDMMLAKEMANEMGMSFNGYINWLIREASVVIPLGGKVSDIKKKKKLDLRDLVREMRKIKNVPETDFSEDDKIIYGL
jgi:hypothetical protein